ncbi:hypothetical protein SO694_00058119 [Aureococcus anophagefferens]|uniref:Uncharacterized protein n=1 Tax=Aureococcus anophagefferens TaxID=44056 RepID=A0ABR1FZ68_AURAN
MSNRYRNNPLTDLTGPFVPGKGQSYFRVEFLANTKAHNYVLSRLRRVLNSMQTHAEERTNAADGTPGRCLATLEELVNKAATQKLICPTTKAGDGDTARSHPFQASPERPDDRLADYSMNTYFLSVLAANVSCAGAWGKPDWYFFEVVCGRSDTVVDCGMTTVPETYALKQPAAHRDLRELLRQGKLPPPLPAEDPPAKRSRVVEPSATPADAAPPAPAQAATPGPPPGRPRAPAVLGELTSQMNALKVKIRQLESQRDQLETEQGQLTAARPGLVLQLNAASAAAASPAMSAFFQPRRA